MNYINEETTNFAKLAGKICSEFTLSHQVEGENFYEFKIEVDRLSKMKDIIPVTISERTLMLKKYKVGDFVKIVGEYRSYNKLLGDKSKLILHFFAKEIEESKNQESENEVRLMGFICKEPIYRKTPFDREICDVLLAVNRSNYHKSDYIPCILWGRNARFVANQNIGSKVEVVGRIQSREYSKILENGQTETKTAYEVSCQRISLFSNITNISEQNSQASEII